MDAFANCDKTFIRDLESPPRTQKLCSDGCWIWVPTTLHCSSLGRACWLPYFVMPAYGERARKAFARGGTTAILVVSCFYPELGDRYSAHRLPGSPFALRFGVPNKRGDTPIIRMLYV